MSYSKDHSRKNPLAPSRVYGMSSSANTNTTPTDPPKYSSFSEAKGNESTHESVDFSTHGFGNFSDAVKHRDAMKKEHGNNWRNQPGMKELQADINRRMSANTEPKKEEVVEEATIEPIKSRPIKKIETIDPIRTIQRPVPFVEPTFPEEQEFPEKRPRPTINFKMPSINFPKRQKKSGMGKSKYRISSRFGGGRGMQKKRR